MSNFPVEVRVDPLDDLHQMRLVRAVVAVAPLLHHRARRDDDEVVRSVNWCAEKYAVLVEVELERRRAVQVQDEGHRRACVLLARIGHDHVAPVDLRLAEPSPKPPCGPPHGRSSIATIGLLGSPSSGPAGIGGCRPAARAGHRGAAVRPRPRGGLTACHGLRARGGRAPSNPPGRRCSRRAAWASR